MKDGQSWNMWVLPQSKAGEDAWEQIKKKTTRNKCDCQIVKKRLRNKNDMGRKLFSFFFLFFSNVWEGHATLVCFYRYNHIWTTSMKEINFPNSFYQTFSVKPHGENPF